MTRWDYLFLEMPVNGGLFLPDRYGSEGWELVSVVKASETIDRMWFKRPKQPKRKPRTTSDQPKEKT